MRILISLIIAILLSSCKQSYNSDKIIELRKNYQSYQKADYNFPGGNNYYVLANNSVDAIEDTFISIHRKIFPKDFPLDELNKDISKWLRDSIFIGFPDKSGSFEIDSVNILKVNSALDYYLNSPITPRFDIYGKCFQFFLTHTTTINGKKIFYSVVPANGKLISNMGEYRIETKGRYIPERAYVGNANPSGTNFRYMCQKMAMDLYFLVSSDDFFKGSLAIPFTDTCELYTLSGL